MQSGTFFVRPAPALKTYSRRRALGVVFAHENRCPLAHLVDAEGFIFYAKKPLPRRLVNLTEEEMLHLLQ